MINYNINKPKEGDNHFTIQGDWAINKDYIKRACLHIYAEDREQAIDLIKKWKIGNVFHADLRRVKEGTDGKEENQQGDAECTESRETDE